MHALVITELRLFEAVLQALALRDLERGPNALVIRPKAHQSRHDGFIGSVSLTRPRKGTVQLDERPLWRAADKTAREQAESTRAGCVRARRPDHDGADDVQQRDHDRKLVSSEMDGP